MQTYLASPSTAQIDLAPQEQRPLQKQKTGGKKKKKKS
jgi:hypothetical protein